MVASRRDLEGSGHHVAVEHHVQVLVERDAREHLLGDRVARCASGVAMRDAGGEFLERHVGQPAKHAGMYCGEALTHVRHAQLLELDGVNRTRHREVVANDLPVPAFLRGPAMHPLAPGSLTAELGGDFEVVARQVVLSEQVDDQRGASRLGKARLARRPTARRPRARRRRCVPRSTARTRAGTSCGPG